MYHDYAQEYFISNEQDSNGGYSLGIMLYAWISYFFAGEIIANLNLCILNPVRSILYTTPVQPHKKSCPLRDF